MSIFSRTTLLSYFQTGEAPTQGQFAALINSVTLEADACVCVKEAKVAIPTAQVLALNTTPVQLVAAPGAGYAIEVLSATMKMVYNSSAYSANYVLDIINTGATKQIRTLSCLNATVNTTRAIPAIGSTGATQTQMLENVALMATANGADPIGGDSDITIYVTYRIIEL